MSENLKVQLIVGNACEHMAEVPCNQFASVRSGSFHNRFAVKAMSVDIVKLQIATSQGCESNGKSLVTSRLRDKRCDFLLLLIQRRFGRLWSIEV